MKLGLLMRFLTAEAVVCFLLTSGIPAQEQPDVLTVDQAVKIAVANNRMLKITSLQLGDAKEDYLAFKTHRFPTFNTYIFASELLAPISFEVPAGQFGSYPGDLGRFPRRTRRSRLRSSPRRM